MKNEIRNATNNSTSLSEIKVGLIDVLARFKENHHEKRLGYVSGIITSDGIENVERNMQALEDHTEELRKKHDFPIFSATDLFDNHVFEIIDAYNIPTQEWLKFWREVLESGTITDVFMTPRWENSKGATDEYSVAKSLGLRIHFKDKKNT